MRRLAAAGSIIALAMLALPGSSSADLAPPGGTRAGDGFTVHRTAGCKYGLLGDMFCDLTLTGKIGPHDTPGQKFELTDVTGSVTIPPDVTNLIISLGMASGEGVFNQLLIAAHGADPEYIDVADRMPLPVKPVKFVSGVATVIEFPVQGSLKVGTFTASEGPDIDMSQFYIEMDLKDSDGQIQLPQYYITYDGYGTASK